MSRLEGSVTGDGLLTIGLVGLGGMGKTHARHYKNVPGCRLAVAYDEIPERLQSFAGEFGVPGAESFDALLERVDAVDICTPTPTHLALATGALQVGKHVLCEKPICRTVEQCQELKQIVDSSGKIFMPAHVVRFFPEFARATKLIADGGIGVPAAVRTRRGGPFPTWAGAWFADFDQSGGVLLDLMLHDFDWLRWTFGEVERVYAKGLLDRKMPQCDYALVTLKFVSGVVGHVEGTWCDPAGSRVTFEVCGDAGMIEYDNRKTKNLQTTIAGGSPQKESPLHPMDDPYRTELAHFVDCCLSGAQPSVTVDDGLKAIAISEAAIESLRTGVPVAPGGGA
jgi:UDP-N-acetylglucosamine 3-dehydrogenase